uniref:NADH dehydrogenase subunit 6 n=1 Tax=Typhlocybinae gen. 1 sp. 2 BY-2021a TaxID=2893158 RepID=A0A9E6XQ67_9HEMI|nr:NADH dehydrogenase subunit 6 [Typhlocybinae gen. 1 sp. 2 BY-2021a]
MLKLMMILSTMSIVIKNPMALGATLLMQTTLIVMMMNKMLNSSWFAMITFMMMIGGLLIMFMYMSSIASNEKFMININMTLMIIIMLTVQDELMIINQMNEDQEMMKPNEMNFSMTKIYNNKSMMLTIMLALYLLLTMISITKIVKHNKGPLRKMNYEQTIS